MRITSVSAPAAAAALAATLSALSAVVAAGPAGGAGPDAGRAQAAAVSGSAAGHRLGSGSYLAVVHADGRTSGRGRDRPGVEVLGSRSVLAAGTLAQDARARLVGRAVDSTACAGLAGRGATVVGVGHGTCLRPGDSLDLAVARLDLTRLGLDATSILAGVAAPVRTTLRPAILPVAAALEEALRQRVRSMGRPAVHLTLGAVQATCHAHGGSAQGSTRLADVHAWVRIPTVGTVDLVRLPPHPDRDARVVMGLRPVTSAVEHALHAALDPALRTVLARLAIPVSPAAVLAGALGRLSGQLAPLRRHLVVATLDQQRRGAGWVRVTALRLRVLPAAAQVIHAPGMALAIGTVVCDADAADPAPDGISARGLPRHIPSGLARAPAPSGRSAPAAAVAVIGVLGVAAIGAGLARYRSLRR